MDYLWESINAMFKTSIFPNSLKLTDVTPLQEKGRKELKKAIDQLVYFQLYQKLFEGHNVRSNICFFGNVFSKYQ